MGNVRKETINEAGKGRKGDGQVRNRVPKEMKACRKGEIGKEEKAEAKEVEKSTMIENIGRVE